MSDARDTAQKYADQQHGAYPADAAEDIPAQEGGVAHFRGAGGEGDESAHDWYEAAQYQGHRAVALEEVLRAIEVFGAQDAGIVLEKFTAKAAA